MSIDCLRPRGMMGQPSEMPADPVSPNLPPAASGPKGSLFLTVLLCAEYCNLTEPEDYPGAPEKCELDRQAAVKTDYSQNYQSQARQRPKAHRRFGARKNSGKLLLNPGSILEELKIDALLDTTALPKASYHLSKFTRQHALAADARRIRSRCFTAISRIYHSGLRKSVAAGSRLLQRTT